MKIETIDSLNVRRSGFTFDADALSARGMTPTPLEVIAHLNARRRPLDQAVCLNPECSTLCTYPRTKGRRPLFCSPSCAKRYSSQRKLLLDDLALIDTALREVAPRSTVGIELNKLRAHVCWHLARYGGEPQRSRPRRGPDR